MFFGSFITQAPQGLVEPGIAQAVLSAEFRGAMNRRASETLDRLKSITIVFRRNTRDAWQRTEAVRFGNSFGVTFSNLLVTAAVLEYGAPDRFRGSPGFSRPPPIRSAVAGAGRTIYDWVQEVDPVFVGEIREQLIRGREKRKTPGENLKPIQQLAAEKAAYAVSNAIFKRGLPSSSNTGLLLRFTRELQAQAQVLQEQDLPEAVAIAFERLNRDPVTL